MGDFEPTDEQRRALVLYGTGQSLAIQAGAGTGKTSTLVLLAESNLERRVQYTAFNKAIVTDIGRKLPENAAANTAHSLAMRQVGNNYRHRLGQERVSSHKLARMLRVDPILLRTAFGNKVLQPDYLASLTMRAIINYCQSADGLPEQRHVPYIEGIDMPDGGGRRTYKNNDIVREHLITFMRAAWRDLNDPQGGLPFKHDHYLKMWERGDPIISADVICFDECQDASPVMMSAVQQQEHAQVVWVGDQAQAIYGFTGAIDAFSHLEEGILHSKLSQSFRFGPAVADVANVILARIDTDMELVGYDAIPTTCGWIKDTADAILTRTNATAVREVLGFQKRGVAVHLVGGGAEIASFARAAQRLIDKQPCSHPELACFNSWGEVQEYVRQDPQGDDLRLMVNLVDEFTVPVILEALDGDVSERNAEVVVSTAHKAKGREWNRVQLAADFPESIESEPDWKLLYVAVTRAKLRLDYFGTKAVVDLAFDAGIMPADVRTDPTARTVPVGQGGPPQLDGMTEPEAPPAPRYPSPPTPAPRSRPAPTPAPSGPVARPAPARPLDPASPARLFDDVEA